MAVTTAVPAPQTGKIKGFPFFPLGIGIFMLARLFAFGGLGWMGISILSLSVIWFGVETTRWLFGWRYDEKRKRPGQTGFP